jgi:hypothetical protein
VFVKQYFAEGFCLPSMRMVRGLARGYAHLSQDTLLAATNSVNTALGGMFMPMVSAGPAAQVQLVQ